MKDKQTPMLADQTSGRSQSDRPDYIQVALSLNLTSAALAKYEVGAREHGPVMLDDPVQAAFEEALDGMNYAHELMRRAAKDNTIPAEGARLARNIFEMAARQIIRIYVEREARRKKANGGAGVAIGVAAGTGRSSRSASAVTG